MEKPKFILAILILCAVVYANSISGGFISDDIATIRDNPNISSFSSVHSLADLANWTSYKISGLNTSSYHIINIILHGICSILVFFILSSFFGSWAAFLATLLFACHPIHTETVTWISGKTYSLSAALILASFILYRRATREDKLKPLAYIFSVILCDPFHTHWYVGLYPLMIITYDVIFGKVKKHWKYWIPYILIVTAWIIKESVAISDRIEILRTPLIIGTNNPIYKFAYSFFAHLQLLLWPAQLTLYHEPARITQQLLFVELFVLFIALFFLPRLFKRSKKLFFGLGIFVLFLAPTYSPVLISWTLAERYLYIPSIGFFMLIAFLIKKYSQTPKAKNIVLIVVMLLIGVFSIRTIIRNQDWKDRATFWQATVKVSPESSKAHNNMGDIYSIEGDLEMAAWSFRHATELNPNYAEGFHNLGFTYTKTKQYDKAIKYYKKAISLDPTLLQSYQNLSAIYLSRGETGLAKKYLQEALRLAPTDADITKNIKEILNKIK